MIDDLDLEELRKIPRFSFYFRYPLHRNNFYDLEIKNRLRGHYTAKPLYGRLTAEGRVDKSAGFNGDIAALFVPLDAETVQEAELFITHTDPIKIVTSEGTKNWKAINAIAEQSIKKRIAGR